MNLHEAIHAALRLAPYCYTVVGFVDATTLRMRFVERPLFMEIQSVRQDMRNFLPVWMVLELDFEIAGRRELVRA